MKKAKQELAEETKDEIMSWQRFRDEGLLQEVNRQFLHPLGLKLELVCERKGKTYIPTGQVQIMETKNSVGYHFGEKEIRSKTMARNARLVGARALRYNKRAFFVQPIGGGLILQ